MADQRLFVSEMLKGWKRQRMILEIGITHQCQRCPDVTCPISKSRYPHAALVSEKFQIVNFSAACGIARQDILGAMLALECMGKIDHPMTNGKTILIKFLQAQDDRFFGGLWPRFIGETGACLLILPIRKNPMVKSLHHDLDTGADQPGDTCRSERNPPFSGLFLFT